MTQSVVITLLFLATAPIALMPAIISMFIRHPARVALLAGNGLLWGGAYLSAKSFSTGSGFFLPIPVLVLCWIGLLAHAVRSAPGRAPLAAPADDAQRRPD